MLITIGFYEIKIRKTRTMFNMRFIPVQMVFNYCLCYFVKNRRFL